MTSKSSPAIRFLLLVTALQWLQFSFAGCAKGEQEVGWP
jgi:hypothetical protein